MFIDNSLWSSYPIQSKSYLLFVTQSKILQAHWMALNLMLGRQLFILAFFFLLTQGVATIRAFDKEAEFVNKSLQTVDRHQQAYHPNVISNKYVALTYSIYALNAATFHLVTCAKDPLLRFHCAATSYSWSVRVDFGQVSLPHFGDCSYSFWR